MGTEDLPIGRDPKPKSKFEGVRLLKDIKPIEIELGEPPEEDEEAEYDEEKEPIWIDFEAGPDPEDDAAKHSGPNTYLISPITEKDLFSDKNINCTAVLGIGQDKESGKAVAFVSHQNPAYFLNEQGRKKFTNDLVSVMKELKDQSALNTIEVVILGGKYDSQNASAKDSTEYKESVVMLSELIRQVFGYDPIVAAPKLSEGGTDIQVATQERKVWIMQDGEPDSSASPYLAHQLEEVASTWQRD